MGLEHSDKCCTLLLEHNWSTGGLYKFYVCKQAPNTVIYSIGSNGVPISNEPISHLRKMYPKGKHVDWDIILAAYENYILASTSYTTNGTTIKQALNNPTGPLEPHCFNCVYIGSFGFGEGERYVFKCQGSLYHKQLGTKTFDIISLDYLFKFEEHGALDTDLKVFYSQCYNHLDKPILTYPDWKLEQDAIYTQTPMPPPQVIPQELLSKWSTRMAEDLEKWLNTEGRPDLTWVVSAGPSGMHADPPSQVTNKYKIGFTFGANFKGEPRIKPKENDFSIKKISKRIIKTDSK